MHFEEFEKASMQELKREAKSCFGRYKDVNTGGLDKPALLLEAQFYMNEMERRHDSWIALRDLLLEIVVILLIGWEIWMSYRGERLQTKDFDAESVVFQNLENSSAATAATLTSLRGTTEAMSGAVQKELELFYDLELTVVYEEGQKKITIENHGRTNVAVWGMHFGTAGNAAYFTEGTIVSAGGGYQNSIQE